MSVVAPVRGDRRTAASTSPTADLSVVICAYTEERWDELVAAVTSAQRQQPAPREVVVVIDYNRRLFERVRERFPDLIVVENTGPRGLSGARNTGIAVSTGAVIAFLDDDAEAYPGWLAALVDAYRRPGVVGVGGQIEPAWQRGRPAWFPPEFDWVVGCSYRGMPVQAGPVRNFIGCNMSFRRDVLAATGGFATSLGRVGAWPVGAEETELCIRTEQRFPGSVLLHEPAARVRHQVPARRACLLYFLTRCFAEGQSKARMGRLVRGRRGLSSEWAYTLWTLPRGVLDNLVGACRQHDRGALARAGLIVGGLGVTTASYLATSAQLWLDRRRRGDWQPSEPPLGASAGASAPGQHGAPRI